MRANYYYRTKKNRNRKRDNIITFMLVLCISIGLVLLANQIRESRAFENDNANHGNAETELLSESSLEISNNLLLVNAKNKVSKKYKPEVVEAYPTINVSFTDISVDKKVLKAADKMFNAAAKKGYPDFFINSGYRSYKRQKEIYSENEDKSFVQKPGASEHQLGLAIDIGYGSQSIDDLNVSSQGKFLRDNAWKYGFILRYPEDKTDITGISYEPWHYRYLGNPHAYYCYKNELSYEEYIDFLKDEKSYSVEIDNSTYHVSYTKPQKNDKIAVPKEVDYSISSDNTGGFIITVKE